MKSKSTLCGALTVLAIASLYGGKPATAAATNCGIQQAAELALQRRLAVIDAAKVNTPDFFSGAKSCIDPALLRSFDLSMMIPDLAGFLSGGMQNIAQQALNQAKQKVCSIINEQIQKVIGNINGVTGQFQTSIGSELSGLLGGGSPITMPSTSGFGTFQFPDTSGIDLGDFTTTTQSYTPVTTTSTTEEQPVSSSTDSSSSSSWLE